MEKLNLVKSNFDQLPNHIEAEQAILGSLLVSNEIYDEISPYIKTLIFWSNAQKFFEAIEKLIFSGMLANPITLKIIFKMKRWFKYSRLSY